MFGRCVALTLLSLVLCPWSLARAHRLDAEYVVLPGHKVQVECWFETGDSPRAAKVQVFRAGGQLLAEGQLNDQGLFIFSFQDVEPLTVVVNAGAGHRKELRIPATRLTSIMAPNGQEVGVGKDAADSSAPVPRVDRSSPGSIKDVLVGVGFLLALAAFVLSLRNARRVRELMRTRPRPDGQSHDATNVPEHRLEPRNGS